MEKVDRKNSLSILTMFPILSNIKVCGPQPILAGEFWEFNSTHFNIAKVEKDCFKTLGLGLIGGLKGDKRKHSIYITYN